jgi:signal transduction histidine kinase
MVKQYVEQDFGGQIVVSSSSTEGTIFKLLFPLHEVKK